MLMSRLFPEHFHHCLCTNTASTMTMLDKPSIDVRNLLSNYLGEHNAAHQTYNKL